MNKNQKILRTIIIIMLILNFLLANSYYLLVKFDGFWLALSGLFEMISFIWLIIAIILLIVRIIKFPLWRKLSNYLFLGVSILYLLYIFFIPYNLIDKNTFQSPVKIKCCYEGTMNTSTLYFRENGEFEDFTIGFFGYVDAEKGIYTQKNDTLFLNFTKGGNRLLSDTIIMKDSVLYKLQDDTLAQTFYYLT